MKSFLFYTTQGYTFSPCEDTVEPDVENCQILGWEKGETTESAYVRLLANNPWIKEKEFTKVVGVEIVEGSEKCFDI